MALLMCLTILPASVMAAADTTAAVTDDDAATTEAAAAPAEAAVSAAAASNAAEAASNDGDVQIVSNGVTIGKFEYNLMSNGTATVLKYVGSATDISIPNTVDYSSKTYRVTTVGLDAMRGENITSVSLPPNVTKLRGGCFAECPNLSSVVIKGDIDTCDQDNGVFAGSGSNMKVKFATTVTKIPAYLFAVPDADSSNYAHLTTIEMSNSITSVGTAAFRNCRDLNKITASTKLASIGPYAFYGCSSLATVTLGSSVKKLGKGSFANCGAMTSLTIQGNLDAVEKTDKIFFGAGASAGGITVTFGTGVGSIPDFLFMVSSADDEDIPKIKRIIFQGDCPFIGWQTFYEITATAYAPAGNETWNADNMLDYGGHLTWDRATKAKITTHPKDVNTLPGKKVTFKVVAEGTALKYQWQVSTDNGKTYTNINNATNASYSISSVTTAMDGNMYRCSVSNTLNTTRSTGAKLTVMTHPTVTTDPAAITVNEGSKATFKVKATGGNLTYQWYYKEYGTSIWIKIKDATKATYSVTATAQMHKYSYYCKIRNEAGTANSAEALLKVVKKPRIVTQPANKTVKIGGNVTFKVKASGSSLKYQWYKRSSSKADWVACAYEQSASLTLSSVKKSWNGYQFRCRVYNGAGVVYTKVVTLTVKK